MVLYHGGTYETNPTRIETAAKALDFGAGFYLTRDKEIAKTWAWRAYVMAGTETPAVSMYEFDETDADGLNALTSTSPGGELLRFVAFNREGR